MSDQSLPLVSVVMPVYNAGVYVGQAVESILVQKFENFEFIIIDDCSQDSSREVVRSYADPRINLVVNEHNLGVAKSLNKGISLARGRYVVRMDADDFSEPSRLARQVAFMDKHPDVGISGSWVWRVDEKKKFLLRYPVGKDCVESYLLFGNPLAHPSVIMRRELLEKSGLRYDPDCSVAQDYELWSRCWHHCALDNIPEPLIRWRLNRDGVTQSRSDTSNQVSLQILKRMLTLLDIHADDRVLKFHREVGNGGGVGSLGELKEVQDWLSFLVRANQEKKVFSQNGFIEAAAFAWYRVCLNSSGLGLTLVWRYLTSSWRHWYKPGHSELFYLFFNSVVKINKSPTGRIYPST